MNQILAETFTGSYLKISYDEMLNPKPVETRTAEEIVNDIKDRLKGFN